MKPISLVLTCLIGLAVPKVGLAQPTITTQPQSQTNIAGATTTFSAEATSPLPIFYQWQKNLTGLTGETDNTLILTNVQTGNAGPYSVIITNAEGAVTSIVATLSVLLPPRITPSPSLQNKPAYVGTLASFTVATTGNAPLAFQWRLDGRELPGQTNRTLTLNAVQAADEGDYTVMVTNVAGAAVSEAIRLYVVPASTNIVLRNFTNTAGLRLPYFFFLPSNYDPTRSYPLLCFFHGAGGDETTHGLLFGPYPETLVFDSAKQQATDPVIMVWPTRRAGDELWTDQHVQQVSGLLDWLPSEFNIDTNRLYVAGFSAGVHAAWDLMGLRPGFFAAARIISGWQGSTSAASIKDVPLWAFHAADDGSVNVSSSRSLIRALRQAGGSPIYTEFISGGHNDGIIQASCIPAGNDWLLTQRRGMGSTVGPLLSITNPTQGAIYITSATNLSLGGSAEAPGPFITPVTWENLANNVKGTGAGTNAWNAMGIPLRANRTNLVIVTATTTSWAPAYGGNTTFNDTLAVVSLPLRATLALQGSGATLNWTGGAPPYRVQRATDLTSGDWIDVLTNAVPPVTLTREHQAEFYRIIGQ